MALPFYTDRAFITFLQDMKKAGRFVFHYNGKGFWNGPAVRIDRETDMITIQKETRVRCQYDFDGKGNLVAYPWARSEKLVYENNRK